MGRYDQALAALQTRRSTFAGAPAIDATRRSRRSASARSFDYQGRFGAAVKSKGEALQAFRELKQRDVSLVEILSGYGNSLSLSGRQRDAAAPLAEALKLAAELKNANLIAQTLRFQTDRFFYSGDIKAGAGWANSSRRLCSAGARPIRRLGSSAQADEAITLRSTIQPTRALAARLGELAQEADARGLKSLSVECAIHRAEALRGLATMRRRCGKPSAPSVEPKRSALKVPLAKAHYLKASVLRAGTTRPRGANTRPRFGCSKKSSRIGGNENVLKRADLAPIHAECVKWSKAT